jgi:hypothetical protein
MVQMILARRTAEGLAEAVGDTEFSDFKEFAGASLGFGRFTRLQSKIWSERTIVMA